MKNKSIIIIVVLILVAGILIYQRSTIMELFKTTNEDKNNKNVTNQNEQSTKALPVVDYEETNTDEADNLTEEQKITEGLENIYKDEYLFQGENFDERRYYINSNYLTNTYKGSKEYFLLNTINNLRSQPDKIIEMFEKYNTIVYGLITRRSYRMSNIDKIVEGLLISYNDIKSNPDHKQILEEIYKVMKFQQGYEEAASQLYPKIEQYISNESLLNIEKIRSTSGKQFSNGDIVWFYSFWSRRDNEHTIDEVYKIINDIQYHYEEEN